MKTITTEARYHDGSFSSEAPIGFTLTETRTERRKEPFMWGEDGSPTGWNNIVSVWHTYTSATESTCNPSEADIARRVELLQESCSTSIIVSYGIRDNEYGAIVAGKCYIVTTQLRHHNVFGDDHPTAVWTEASPEVFAAELRRVAIRQLLAERGAK